MYNIYIIKSIKTGKHYIGSTGNIKERLKEHNKNQVRSTKNKGPYHLAHKEELETKTEAIKREHEIKKYKGNNKFIKLIKPASPSSSQV